MITALKVGLILHQGGIMTASLNHKENKQNPMINRGELLPNDQLRPELL
jgi:hypothetical protein